MPQDIGVIELSDTTSIDATGDATARSSSQEPERDVDSDDEDGAVENNAFESEGFDEWDSERGVAQGRPDRGVLIEGLERKLSEMVSTRRLHLCTLQKADSCAPHVALRFRPS